MSLSDRVLLGGALVLAGACIAVTLLLRWPDVQPAVQVSAAANGVAPAPLRPAAAVAAAVAAAPATPTTKQTASANQGDAPRTDAQGNLLIERGLRDYFDGYLAKTEEQGLDASVRALVSDAGTRLKEPALGQLSQLLSGYLAYLQATLQEPAPAVPLDGAPDHQLQVLRDGLERKVSLRRERLGPLAAAAFFAAEEAQERFTLDNLSLELRDDLSPEARAAAAQALREGLPAAEQARLQEAQAEREEQDELRRLLSDGADEVQVRELLARRHDAGEVERQLAEQREARVWQQQYADYRQELQSLLGSGLPTAQQQTEILALRERRFAAAEQFKVQALDARADFLEQRGASR
ncbi:lipase chaperone [Pseudomonas sp. UL073]|uniref:Lipase chaperone n=1 Tax=Zestomonas insulae TaxID=2809017 RepID=A0ABS2I8P2_9GAMM|nr:lipase secretion chaperone [Pseudomonas insulae]MBM7059514.1 lipase chaperone [Pseudomonas insulae]